MSSPFPLPSGLPAPIDDGAADHLFGLALPSLGLPSTDGGVVNLAEESRRRRVVVFGYPKTGRPGQEMPKGWDMIPGARGCTPEACAFRDLNEEFEALDTELFGISAQPTDYQREAVERLHLPYLLLSDAEGELTRALRLPTFEVAGETLLRRLTLVLRDGVVEHVFYPVFPPDEHPSQVLSWLREASAAG